MSGKHTINQRTNALLKMLLKNPGGYVNLSLYRCSNATREELFKRITTMLSLMGIHYQVMSRTYTIRILTEEQVEAWKNLKSGAFSQRYGYKRETKYLGKYDIIRVDEVT